MKEAYRPVLFIGLAVVAIAGIALVKNATRPRELVAWGQDFTAAQEAGKRQGKPVLVYFTAVWCGPCQRMRETTFADRAVADAIAKDYVAVKVDIDKNQDLALGHKVDAIPTFEVLNSVGEPVKRSDVGYLDSAGFLAWLRGT